jgi:hypothetical protein
MGNTSINVDVKQHRAVYLHEHMMNAKKSQIQMQKYANLKHILIMLARFYE